MGISFYTFQTLSYSIDVYNGKIQAEKNLGKFALYVSFFPQLVAGPIERASDLIPQLHEKKKFNFLNLKSGIFQIILGFFKKVVVADTLGIYVDSIYDNFEYNFGLSLIIATYFFAFQIYCDFSGYSDIAIGCARIMGFNFMENFKLPYFSKSVTEFWRRWHISLSSWLRDYLYIPLGGNRKGTFSTYKNLMITMLLGGLWHGASWNFVIWGFFNGLYLAIEKRFNITNFYFKNKLISSFILFNLICFTWIFFRSETIEQSFMILQNITNFNRFLSLRIQNTSIFASIILNLIILICLEYFLIRKKSIIDLVNENKDMFIISIQVILIYLIIIFGQETNSQFIYFQF
ncbi:MBOAT family O-acyltransferase [Flammeovirga sp. MY04]|uniref:MBOAT family O-acyltransferase n=1 Tax=Flammeovirga sp. MY04 TaxID=1191459 RepID=UPI00080626B3|nr:MBOAT family O-acyltransferase [Flammeovirga sp. MY04]